MIAYMSVLVMTMTPHVHREYEHVRPWRRLLGGASLSPLVGPANLFDSLGNAPETYHRHFVNGPQ